MERTFNFSKDAWNYNNARLTNQIYKLLPMYENDEDWIKQLETIVIELHGYNDIFENSSYFMVLIAKLEGLKYITDRKLFRKTVFEAISILKEIKI